jgi:hypothetical protein
LKSECPYIKQLLSEYIDGALDALKMTAVREHMNVCGDCRREHEVLKYLISRMGNIKTVKAPDNFLEKFHDRIKSDSVFDRIRKILSSIRISTPVELAAFAATAAFILFFFNFFTLEEKGVSNKSGNENIELAMDQGTSPAQNAPDQRPAVKPVESPSSVIQIKKQQIPIMLALSLTTEEESVPIPSQSVSFGSSGAGFTADDLGIWQSETGNTSTRRIQPDDVNQKIDDIIKSVEGKLIFRQVDAQTGYPTGLKLDIPAINYSRFISRIEKLGSLKAAAPDLPDGSEGASILIQMELTNQE